MVVVVGMARSGLAVSRLLQSRGVEVFATDSDPDPVLRNEFDRMGIAHEAGLHSIDRFVGAREVIVSPGVPLDIDPLVRARKNGVGIVSELEVATRYLEGDIVAVTGSNGKTTTTSLVGHILRRGPRPVQVGGNIGTPVSDLVETSTEDTINVIEVSSFQLDGISRFRPRVGVLLNITPDHLDRYTDFEAYRSVKFQLFRNQTEEDFAIVNRDDPQSFPSPVPIVSRQRVFSRSQQLDPDAGLLGGVLCIRGHRVLPTSEVPLLGSHNVENVLAAILVADVYGISPPQMAGAIRNFEGVEHRLETVATVDGVEFVNDSKATNVDSAIKAVRAFDKNIIIILGGKDKDASFEPLVQAMSGRVRQVLTIGAAAEKLEQAIGGLLPIRRVESIREAVDLSMEIGRHGDVVLLAPACASFDMYENYAERGRDFKNAVRSHLRAIRS